MTDKLVIIAGGLKIAYDYLVSNLMPNNHYENFPVASILLPRRLRPAVKTIYAFARSADDLADEGEAQPEERLAALANYEVELDRIEQDRHIESPLFLDLAKVVAEFRLPLQPLRDLLSAFKQDVTVVRYPSFDAVMDYCRRSANPVGILMLYLYGAANDRNLRDSDAICSALQLINFWQDIALDWRKGRIYLPQEDLVRFGVAQADIAAARTGEKWRNLMQFEVGRARALLNEGASLALRLNGRIGWELRLVVQGGLRILQRIEAADYDVFRHRPLLGKSDWPRVAWGALRMG